MVALVNESIKNYWVLLFKEALQGSVDIIKMENSAKLRHMMNEHFSIVILKLQKNTKGFQRNVINLVTVSSSNNNLNLCAKMNVSQPTKSISFTGRHS